jgi:hypothetical protein
MKKLLAFAMILSLGVFCAVGCTEKPKTTKPTDKGTVTTPEKKPVDTAKPGDTTKPEEKPAPK